VDEDNHMKLVTKTAVIGTVPIGGNEHVGVVLKHRHRVQSMAWTLHKNRIVMIAICVHPIMHFLLLIKGKLVFVRVNVSEVMLGKLSDGHEFS